MKEQLITFETAKLVKEKGFDVPTKMYYENSLTEQVHDEDGKSGPFGWEKDELNLQSGYFINNWKDSDLSNKSWYMCSAPTQSLLQKWLREVHKIHIEPQYSWLLDKDKKTRDDVVWWYYIYPNYPHGIRSKTFSSEIGEPSTYEEALEIGLQEALKLIK